MARPAGRRNRDFELKRAALRQAVWQALVELGPGASLRDLADRVEVTPSTLKHYLGDRDQLFAAIALDASARGAPFMALTATPTSENAHDAILQALRFLHMGWTRFGVDRVHRVGLAEGLLAPERGPTYLRAFLEPSLDAFEKLLAALIARGSLPTMDVRAGALALVAPVLLALLHQTALGGAGCRPLDIEGWLTAHAQGWLRGYGAPTSSPHGPAPGSR